MYEQSGLLLASDGHEFKVLVCGIIFVSIKNGYNKLKLVLNIVYDTELQMYTSQEKQSVK